MPIIRTTPTSNFTQIDNTLLNSSMPAQAKNVLLYLLSKPKDWQPKPHDIRKQLCLSAYAVKKALRWLCSAGYAAYDRLKSGHTIWRIFSNPVAPETGYSPAISPQVEIPQVENRPVLITLETEQILKQQPAAPMPPIVDPIVVVSDELIYPAQLTLVQKKAAKAVIKKVKAPELRQEVLFALAYAITSGRVKNPVAYLDGIVKRANNGTFEAVTNNTGSTQETAADRAERTRRQVDAARSVKVDNAGFFADLQKRFGSKAAAAIPVTSAS